MENRPSRTSRPFLTRPFKMRPVVARALALLPCLAIACCSAGSGPPDNTAQIAPPPPTQPAGPIRWQAPENWMDQPQAPGNWEYITAAEGSFARFGTKGAQPVAIFACNKAQRSVTIARRMQTRGIGQLRIRTETQQRTLPAQPSTVGLASVNLAAANLPPRDSLLDAIALSRGRFVIEGEGAEPLYLPAWPEISRVLEDCR